MRIACARGRSFGGRVVAALLLFAPLAGAAAESTGLLDGQTFEGPSGAEGRPAYDIDQVVFADGRFLSVECARWGFGDAAYQTWRDGDVVRFRAVTESPDRGTLAWEGEVADDRIEATFVWTKERLLWTTRRTYWFRGTRVDPAESGDVRP